jgi:hypothetical protein
MTVSGITPEARRSIAGVTTIEARAHAADSTTVAVRLTRLTAGSTANAAERGTTPNQGTGLLAGTTAEAAKLSIVLRQRPSPSMAIERQRVDILNPADRAVLARGRLAVTTMADRKGAFLLAEAPALAVEAFMVAAVAAVAAVDVTNRRSWMFSADRELEKRRQGVCSERNRMSPTFIGLIFLS